MMKKIAMMMAVALAGVASAITVSWADAPVASGSFGTSADLSAGYQSTKDSSTIYSVSATGRLPGNASAIRTLFCIYNGVTSQGVGVALSGAGELILAAGTIEYTNNRLIWVNSVFSSTNNDYYKSTDKGAVSAPYENLTYSLTIERDADGVATINLYNSADATGTAIHSLEVAFGDVVLNKVGIGKDPAVLIANAEDAQFGALTNATIKAGTVAVPDVPEPTALALLALGVAGLALKRKVA